MVRAWLSPDLTRSSPDLEGDLRALTFNVLAATALQKAHYPNINSAHIDDKGDTTKVYRDILHTVLANSILLMLIPYGHLTRKFMPKGLARIGRAAASFKLILMDLINEEEKALADEKNDTNPNRNSMTEPGGLITPLVRALKPKTVVTPERQTDSSKESANKKRKTGTLSAHEIPGNVFAINFAGHDTVLIALSFTLTLLAGHREIQDWLREEITNVVVLPAELKHKHKHNGDAPPELDYTSSFPRLVRCQAVFLETLRLYAPVTGVPKVAAGPTTSIRIGSRAAAAVSIPQRTEVFPMLMAFHSHENWVRSDYLSDKSRNPGQHTGCFLSLHLGLVCHTSSPSEPVPLPSLSAEEGGGKETS